MIHLQIQLYLSVLGFGWFVSVLCQLCHSYLDTSKNVSLSLEFWLRKLYNLTSFKLTKRSYRRDFKKTRKGTLMEGVAQLNLTMVNFLRKTFVFLLTIVMSSLESIRTKPDGAHRLIYFRSC